MQKQDECLWEDREEWKHRSYTIPGCGRRCQRHTKQTATISHQREEWCSVDMDPLRLLTPLERQAYRPLWVHTCINVEHKTLQVEKFEWMKFMHFQ
jgi:hypothetical protein